MLKALLLLAATIALTAYQTASAASEKEEPIIVAVDWETPPFEYSDIYGRPSGFVVDIISELLEQTGKSYRITTNDWTRARQMFEDGKADIVVGPVNALKSQDKNCYVSQSILVFSKIKVAYHRGTAPIDDVSKMASIDSMAVKLNNAEVAQAVAKLAPQAYVEYHSPRDALAGLANGKYRYFVWTELPLKWKIKELGLADSMMVSNATLGTVELRFACRDAQLGELLDDIYARLELNGTLSNIQDKWFHPERVHDNASPVSLYIIAIALVLGIFFFTINRVARARVKKAISQNDALGNMIHQVFQIGDYAVIRYDMKKQRFTNSQGMTLPSKGFTMEQFLEHIHPDDRNEVKVAFEKIMEGKLTDFEQDCRWNKGTPKAPVWQFIHGHAVAETDAKGRVTQIVGSTKNITQEREQELQKQELATKYQKMFENQLAAMSFYDSDGRLLDMNTKMRDMCCTNEAAIKFFYDTRLFDVPVFRQDFDPNSRDNFHVCQHMCYPEMGIDNYIEYEIHPVVNSHGQLTFYSVTVHNVTEERNIYLNQRQQNKQQQEISNRLNDYEQQLHDLLESSKMYVFRSVPQEQSMRFSRSISQLEYKLSYEEFVNLLYEKDREGARQFISNNNKEQRPFNVVRHFRQTPISKEPLWYLLSAIPTYDAKGEFTGHFGVMRDIDELMQAQEQLKRETERAEQSGMMKSAFLANMTHEIRTPLNAIVGFSDLLQFIEEPSERQEFIRIILNNCDMLLRLINDILEVSRADRGQLSIVPEVIDFAPVFDDICQTLAQRVEEPGVEFIKVNPCEHFTAKVDKGRVQQVCTNFVTNAVKYTHQGHIKLGYEPRDGGLYIYCEDTGAGIEKEKQASVFERFVKLNDFVQGTGLGLNICRSIAERCGGKIGVFSDGPGHGSTFWFWIPC